MSDVENDNVENDVIENEQPEVVEDPLKNLKSEMHRKLESQNSRFDQMNSQLNSIMETIQAKLTPQKEENSKSLKDLAFDDPEEYARIVEERATRKANEVATQQIQRQSHLANVVSDIQSKYPEFSQEGSEAARLAIQKMSQLPKHMQGTPEGAKLVMMEAAADLGLVPTSRRNRGSGDDFVLSGQSNPGSGKKKSDPLKEIDQKTLEWAVLLDPSIQSDPKRIENLKKAQNRKRWNKYE